MLAVEYLFKLDTAEAMKRRAILTTTFNAVGRTGETAKTNWKNCYYDEEQQNLFMDWSEPKVSKQKPMSFVSDADCYYMDFFHALACYYISGGGYSQQPAEDGSEFVFPELAKMKGSGATNTITNYLKHIEKSKQVPSMPPDVTGTCLRVGSANMIVEAPNVELIHGIARGENSVWIYSV